MSGPAIHDCARPGLRPAGRQDLVLVRRPSCAPCHGGPCQDQDSASTEYGRGTESGMLWAEGSSIIGEEIRKSALARLQATGMFHTTASRSSALTSVSCGCGWSGSQKKSSRSKPPSGILAPIGWSPPSGPLRKQVTSSPSSSLSSRPVVPVASRSWELSRARLYRAHSIRSVFLLSCAMSAISLRLAISLPSGSTIPIVACAYCQPVTRPLPAASDLAAMGRTAAAQGRRLLSRPEPAQLPPAAQLPAPDRMSGCYSGSCDVDTHRAVVGRLTGGR